MSEVLGGATKCPECKALNFDPQVLAEVVEFEGSARVQKGHGRLVVTELFPFGMTQPLVRYYNGDIVEATTVSCSLCGPGEKIVHIGRDNESCFVGHGSSDRQLVLGSNELRELAYCEHVARTCEYPHLDLLRDRDSHIGAPFLEASASDGNAARVTIKFKPKKGLSAKAAEERLRQHALKTSQTLNKAVEGKAVELEILASDDVKILWK